VERRKATPAWLWAAGALFLVSIVFILVTSVSRPDPPVYALSTLEPREPPPGPAGPDTVTLDARSGDHWTRFDLETRGITTDPTTWDIAVKRHRLIVNGGEGFAAQAGVQAIGSESGRLADLPAESFQSSRVTGGGDTVSAVLDDWYDYSFFSHLLEPAHDVAFAVRTAEGSFARLRVLSYYCPGPEPGCMTLEYVLLGR
jgi:hypothetical protein